MGKIADEILLHYGVKRRSGRYPWGSGDTPFQRSGDFLSRVEDLRSQNITYIDKRTGKTYKGDTAIAKTLGMSTTQFRVQVGLAGDERRALEVDRARALREKGYSYNTIADMMGYKNDSSIRSLLNADAESRMKLSAQTAELLKKHVDEKGFIDVGIGVERQLGISREKLEQALEIMQMEGYEVYGRGVAQVTNKGQQTIFKVLCPPGTEYPEVFKDTAQIHYIDDVYSRDGGETFSTFQYPSSMDSNRVQIRYADDGGSDKDGLIEIRRGVDDLSLGESRYAQVRILVDDKKYMKGMAVYSDDLPDGVDVIYNTNKSKDTPKDKVFKDITKDPDNPFGSYIKPNGQSTYIDKNGKEQLSLINKRAEEGDWSSWSNKLSAQFLSKQNRELIKQQINLSITDKKAELSEIMSLTNPTVKKVLLKTFSDDCDAASVHLKTASLPGQKYKVILPMPSLKDNEVYAPDYKSGEKVALVRYPHGGTFEIPILTVNNKHKDSIEMLGKTPTDAITINKKVADRLSGADFDGDTVMVIPTNSKTKITSTPPLEGLKGFDNKLSYGYDEIRKAKDGTERYFRGGKEIKIMKNTQTEMGKISNLITDMTLLGATDSEKAKAVKHSMVVIDAEKHKLDYKQSEKDNDITLLKKKYQGRIDDDGKYKQGAATLISRASAETTVLKRQGSPKIDTNTGELKYKEVREEYIDKNGKVQVRTQKSTQMRETPDAYSLVSEARTQTEKLYADYANTLKSMANNSRLSLINTSKIAYSKSAKETYDSEVKSLDSKLNVSLMNAPKERQAQALANSIVNAKTSDNPDLTKSEIKKISQQALESSRNSVGAERVLIKISDKEWEAIQAGAISENKLLKILNNTDIDEVRERAMPKTTTQLSSAKINKMTIMKDSGYTTAEIANSLGVSTSTVSKYLKGGN